MDQIEAVVYGGSYITEAYRHVVRTSQTCGVVVGATKRLSVLRKHRRSYIIK